MTFAVAFGTPFLFYARSFFAHAWTASLLFLAWDLLRERGRPRRAGAARLRAPAPDFSRGGRRSRSTRWRRSRCCWHRGRSAAGPIGAAVARVRGGRRGAALARPRATRRSASARRSCSPRPRGVSGLRRARGTGLLRLRPSERRSRAGAISSTRRAASSSSRPFFLWAGPGFAALVPVARGPRRRRLRARRDGRVSSLADAAIRTGTAAGRSAAATCCPLLLPAGAAAARCARELRSPAGLLRGGRRRSRPARTCYATLSGRTFRSTSRFRRDERVRVVPARGAGSRRTSARCPRAAARSPRPAARARGGARPLAVARAWRPTRPGCRSLALGSLRSSRCCCGRPRSRTRRGSSSRDLRGLLGPGSGRGGAARPSSTRASTPLEQRPGRGGVVLTDRRLRRLSP